MPKMAEARKNTRAKITTFTVSYYLHSKTPHVVTVLWLDSDDVVTILSSTS